jgi:FixJ family two-component response regulator
MPNAAAPTMPSRSPLIALVENDLPANRAFTRLLRAYGYAVEPHLSAESFLARTAPEQPDCLLLDIDLDGMSGLELLQQLREQDIATPAVFLTGRPDPGAQARARALGCHDFLQKPIEGHRLVAAIELACNANESPANASPAQPSKGASPC